MLRHFPSIENRISIDDIRLVSTLLLLPLELILKNPQTGEISRRYSSPKIFSVETGISCLCIHLPVNWESPVDPLIFLLPTMSPQITAVSFLTPLLWKDRKRDLLSEWNRTCKRYMSMADFSHVGRWERKSQLKLHIPIEVWKRRQAIWLLRLDVN